VDAVEDEVVDVEVEGEIMREDEEVQHIRVESGRRKRIFWIWGSTWIRRLQ
jgi:hypothetical protein